MSYPGGHNQHSGYSTSSNEQGYAAGGLGLASAVKEGWNRLIKGPSSEYGDQGGTNHPSMEPQHSSRGYHQHPGGYQHAPAQVEYRTREERYRAERNSAEAHVSELQETVKSLTAQLNQQDVVLAQTKESAARINYAKEDKELILGPQALDQQVKAPFQTLQSHLNSWSKRFASDRDVDTSRISGNFWEDIQIVAPSFILDNTWEFFGHKSTRRKIITAWVWLCLTRHIFRSFPEGSLEGSLAKDRWMTRDQEACFRGLEIAFHEADRKIVSYRDCNDWRALTASLLKKIGPGQEAKMEQDEHVENICNDVIATVSVWAIGPDTKGFSEAMDQATRDHRYNERWAEYAETMRRELRPVVVEAMDFAGFLRVQRANWTVRFPKPIKRPSQVVAPKLQPATSGPTASRGKHTTRKSAKSHPMPEDQYLAPETIRAEAGAPCFLLDPETMQFSPPLEDDARTDDKFVKVIFTPALFKRGTLDGADFDTLSCLVQSQVLWSDLDKVGEQFSPIDGL